MRRAWRNLQCQVRARWFTNGTAWTTAAVFNVHRPPFLLIISGPRALLRQTVIRGRDHSHQTRRFARMVKQFRSNINLIHHRVLGIVKHTRLTMVNTRRRQRKFPARLPHRLIGDRDSCLKPFLKQALKLWDAYFDFVKTAIVFSPLQPSSLGSAHETQLPFGADGDAPPIEIWPFLQSHHGEEENEQANFQCLQQDRSG